MNLLSKSATPNILSKLNHQGLTQQFIHHNHILIYQHYFISYWAGYFRNVLNLIILFSFRGNSDNNAMIVSHNFLNKNDSCSSRGRSQWVIGPIVSCLESSRWRTLKQYLKCNEHWWTMLREWFDHVKYISGLWLTMN